MHLALAALHHALSLHECHEVVGKEDEEREDAESAAATIFVASTSAACSTFNHRLRSLSYSFAIRVLCILVQNGFCGFDVLFTIKSTIYHSVNHT